MLAIKAYTMDSKTKKKRIAKGHKYNDMLETDGLRAG